MDAREALDRRGGEANGLPRIFFYTCRGSTLRSRILERRRPLALASRTWIYVTWELQRMDAGRGFFVWRVTHV